MNLWFYPIVECDDWMFTTGRNTALNGGSGAQKGKVCGVNARLRVRSLTLGYKITVPPVAM